MRDIQVFFVDNNHRYRQHLTDFLSRVGIKVRASISHAEFEGATKIHADVAIVTIKTSQPATLETVREILKYNKAVPVIIMLFADSDFAEKQMKIVKINYILTKVSTEPVDLLKAIAEVVRKKSAYRVVARLKHGVSMQRIIRKPRFYPKKRR